MSAVSNFLAKLQSHVLWDLRKEDSPGILGSVTEQHAKELLVTGQAVRLDAGERAAVRNRQKKC